MKTILYLLGAILFFSVFVGVLSFGFPQKTFAKEKVTFEVNPVRVYFFHSVTCPHCHDEIEFLEKVQKTLPHVEVFKFEVSEDFRNRSLFRNVIERYKLSGGVPATIIGEEVFVGFDDEKGVGQELLTEIASCSVSNCDSWLDETLGKQNSSETKKVSVSEKVVKALGIAEQLTADQNSQETLPADQANDAATDHQKEGHNDVRIFGKEFCLEGQSSTCAIGVVLGLADGINPCMFSVLIFLLSYLLAIGSRKKALKAGLVFCAVTFLVYFLFMLGIVKIVDVLGVAKWLRLIVIWFALFAGAVMIKDFFAYGKWFSLEIPKRAKPALQRLIKKGTLPSAALLALLASIVELPCTSGLPLAYVAILSSRELNPLWYLALYNFFFVLPLLVIIIFVTFAWAKTEKFEQQRKKWRKYMRLVAGVLLVLLAVALWQNWI